ncbi:MAG: tyrosine-type recombinase/integrase [Arenimonas sp.]
MARPPRELTEAEAALQLRMLDEYFCGHRLARGHDPHSVGQSRSYVETFLAYVGQPIWECSQADFSSWAAHMAQRPKAAPGTQLSWQGAVATFFNFLVDSQEWQTEVQRQFSTRIIKVATRANRRVHNNDAITRPRQYLTADECNQFFQVMEKVVEIAAVEMPRSLRHFQRDRAMFFTYYVFGLRLSEGWGLNLHSFVSNPKVPEYGRWSAVHVFNGKGSNGSGPKPRTVQALIPSIRDMLDWYVEDVRPLLKVPDDDLCMWPSERRQRMSRPAIWLRYKEVVTACGFAANLFTTHGLRHMFSSHQAQADVPAAYTSAQLGHGSMAVTAEYMHFPETYVEEVAYNFIRQSLANPEGLE